MMEVNGGNDYKIWHLGKQALPCQFGHIPHSFQATAQALQGDGSKIHNSGDNKNSDAGARNGVVEQMIIPV